MTNKVKSLAFSNGQFEKIYDFIADNAVWTVIEENTFTGKKAIVANCEQVGNYFKSVTTKFETLNVVEDKNKVVVNGTAEFLKNKKRVSFISACDLYEFNHNDQIQKITSYCIPSEK
ncbi:MAG: nuclear transport factor 2 family protein [Crocinitomicaceae bacterium]|jgi:ketosteroid isomerase-like protein